MPNADAMYYKSPIIPCIFHPFVRIRVSTPSVLASQVKYMYI